MGVVSLGSALRDAIAIGREIVPLGVQVYRTIRQKRKNLGQTAPVRIEDLRPEIEARARDRRRWIEERFPDDSA